MSKLYFRYGAMNSGKTTSLLQVVHNYQEQGLKIKLLKPMIDTKAGSKVSSRIGIEKEADILIPKDGSILRSTYSFLDLKAIVVDEVQFLNASQIDELYYITKQYDIPVICYGLRCDFRMEGFEGSTRLLQIADDIEELKTICKCGLKATQNMRTINDTPVFTGDQVVIDNNSLVKYEPVCGKCYIKYKYKGVNPYEKL